MVTMVTNNYIQRFNVMVLYKQNKIHKIRQSKFVKKIYQQVLLQFFYSIYTSRLKIL